MTTPDPLPYRVVDAHGNGWISLRPSTAEEKAFGQEFLYSTGTHGETKLTYQQLTERLSPVRVVALMPDEHRTLLVEALLRAGRKAVASLASALHEVAREAEHRNGGHPTDLLVAGRPGSWEAEDLKDLAWHIGAHVGTSTNRVDARAVAVCENILQAWLFSPGQVVEVAENLAAVFGAVVDAAGGWEQVADDDLLRNERLRLYLTSLSEFYPPTIT